MDSTAVHIYSRALTLSLAALCLMGCPKKIEYCAGGRSCASPEQISNAQKQCEPTTVAPKVSGMVAVSLATSGTRSLAVLSNGHDALIGAVGQTVGAEKAVITDISQQSVTIRFPDSRVERLPLTTAIPQTDSAPAESAGTPVAEGAAKPEADAPTIDPKDASAYARWRISAVKGLSRGHSIPLHVIKALSLAFSDHSRPTVANALNNLGWSNLSTVSQAYITRLSMANRKVTIRAEAPHKQTYDEIFRRLRGANPLITSVKALKQSEKNTGYSFELELEAPMMTVSDIAMDGAAASSGLLTATLDDALRKKLETSAGRIAPKNSFSTFEQQVRTQAERVGLQVNTIQNIGEKADGYMGRVSFKLEANGTALGLMTFLGWLRELRTKRPVLVDSLVVEGSRIQMMIHAPFVTGKIDTRKPTPGSLILPSLTNHKWEPTNSLSSGDHRDPFKRP